MTFGSVVKAGRPRRSNAPPPLPMYERVVLKHVPTMVRRKYDKLDIEKLTADENNEDTGRQGGAIDVDDRDLACETGDHVEDKEPYSEQEDSLSEQGLCEDEDTSRLEEDAHLTYVEVDCKVAGECLDRGEGDSIDGAAGTLKEDVDSETIQLTDSPVGEDSTSESEVVAVASHQTNVDEALGDGNDLPVKDSKSENEVVTVASHEACNIDSDIKHEALGTGNKDSDDKHDSPAEDSESESEVVAVATRGFSIDSNLEDENSPFESSNSSVEDSESESEVVAIATRGFSIDSNVVYETHRDGNISFDNEHDASEENSASESEVVAAASHAYVDPKIEDEGHSDGNLVSDDEYGHCRSEDNGANAARDICVIDETGDKGEGNSDTEDSRPSEDCKSEEHGTKDADCAGDVDANVDVETKEDECRNIDNEQERKTSCEDIDSMKSILGLKIIDTKTEGCLVQNVKLAGDADASPENEVQKAHKSFHNEKDSGSDGSKESTEKDVYELCCPICQHCITRTIVFRRRENNQQDRTTCLTFLTGLFPCFRQ